MTKKRPTPSASCWITERSEGYERVPEQCSGTKFWVLGAGVLQTPDCLATYEELKAKGIAFKSAPKEQFYGIEALITDGVGNWFSMTQPK
jgi:hypothetical protein